MGVLPEEGLDAASVCGTAKNMASKNPSQDRTGKSRPISLSDEEMRRYSRHLVLPEVAVEGQLALKSASVLLVGAGGLGAPAGLYLAAAGVGKLGIVDFDVVDLANLQRQIAFGTSDVGRRKLEAAADRLRDLNPHVSIATHETRLTRDNALETISGYDVVVDGSDNFATRYLVNDACVLLGKPDVYGSVLRFKGQASVFGAAGRPCYRCLYPEPPPAGRVPSCAEAGVLGVLPGIIGSIQAAEAIKLIIGAGDVLSGRLLAVDGLTMTFREFRVQKDPECPLCGPNPTIGALADYDALCGPSASPSESGTPLPEISPRDLKAMMEAGRNVVLIDVREPYEHAICHLDGQLIPLTQLAARLDELDPARDTVVLCRTGVRSAFAVEFLRRMGFERVWNLRGGLAAWSDDVDPRFPKY